MFGFFHPAADVSAERRLRRLEDRLDRLGRTGGRRAFGSLPEASDQIGPAIMMAVSEVINRFLSSRRSINRFLSSRRSVGEDVMRFGNDAAKLGNGALNRLSTEIGHRALMTLAIALGFGILVGMFRRG